uniref:Kinesin motor domain-containing protein n=1 Tax=Anopheles epiroticus TaxID=199890 RepID=A0A182PQ58_9DIPT
MSGPECVKVAVRIRPMSQSEKARGCQTVVEQSAPDQPQILVCGGRTPSDVFSYNYVFPPNTVQSALYEVSVAPLLRKLFAGYNATILAYGQTSSGKTFTMGTDFAGEMGESVGVIPRAITEIFRTIAEAAASGGKMDTRVACSFYEVYQDNVYDLLAEKASGSERQLVEIREAAGGDILLQGLTEVPASSEQCAFECLARGSLSRVVRATAMNNVSSRSHAIFTLTLLHTARDDPSVVTRSKFHLVDLAGSERSKKTATTGDRFKEGVEINKCLLALGNVITALGNSNAGPGKVHVPYRSSKLTRLLQDSLGGNSFTLMIACVSPADYNLSETYSTLRYAYRVCKIKNKPIINQDPQQARIKELEAIIQDLRVEVLSLKSGQNGPDTPQDGEFRVPKPVKSQLVRGLTETELIRSPRHGENGSGDAVTSLSVQKLQETNRFLQQQLHSTLHELESNEMRAMTAEKLLEDFEQVLQKEEKAEEEGQMRRELLALLSAYKEEIFALGNMSAPNPPIPTTPRAVSADASMRSQEIERKSEYHTQQQMRIHSELSQLKRELALKEQLHAKYMGNSAAVLSLTSDRERELTEQLRECEGQIRGLEDQLAELNTLLENTKASEKRSKLAEERRRKVQQLESELAELRKKSMRQAKLLKVNEKDVQRIAGLTAEIQQMKVTRVKLLKTLRTESENFRQWRLTREKEITQLKAKDRKRQYELQKLESTYSLQKRIMQRKMDETILVNKRLKATLERRQRNLSTANACDRSVMRGAEAARWIKHELELIYNTVDGTVTLNMLRTQRAQQSKKLTELRAQLAELVGAVGGGEGADPDEQRQLQEEIRQCETDLDYRNAQIADLQQKIHTMDTDSQVATFSEGLAKLPEGREAFQRLLQQLVQTHTRLIETRFQLVELQATSDCQEEALAQARAQLLAAEQQYREEVVQLEKTYEDKLSLLLMQRAAANGGATVADPGEEAATLANPSDSVHEEAIRRIEQLRDELELYKRSAQMLREELNQATKLPPRKRRVPLSLLDPDTEFNMRPFEDDEPIASEDDNEDPDFRLTPMWKRKRGRSDSLSIRESLMSRTLQVMNTTTNLSKAVAGSSCTCTGNCGTRRCGCHKMDNMCNASCKCPPACVNRILMTVPEGSDPAAAAAVAGPLDVSSGSNTSKPGETLAPDNTSATAGQVENKENLAKPTSVNEKREPDERDTLDILEYVAKYRKRRPLLDV